ncbi:MAG: hypothetical protein DRQ62_05995 [Gammaproteobacteria bacterium]|nr:MAG: hypothetical protein DRQ62_05995 [Gammaproteobacteria bacterium]
MVFIMRDYRNSKALLFCCFIAMLSVGQICYAGGKFVKIEQAQLDLVGDKALLDVKLTFQLSPSAEEALHSGIALYWDVAIILKQKLWRGLWYKTLFARTYRYSLSYYTLLNNYRVQDEYKKSFRRFSTLHEALVFMQHIRTEGMVLDGYDRNQCIISVLNISFDKEMLPAPLRPVAYFDKQWDLSSKERLWCE